MSDSFREQERKGFLEVLEANEDDRTTRMVYSDWLEEGGEYEEAERQRAWPKAKAWMMGILTQREDWYEPDDYTVSYQELIEMGRRCVQNDDNCISCGSDETLQGELRSNSERFWQNWSIVTGIPVPPGFAEDTYYSCSC